MTASPRANPRWLRLAAPLTPVYAAAVAARNAAYAHHWLPIRALQAPVVSIGNLSVGGAGKTPLVIHLAQLLSARGIAVDVLSRGYGRRASHAEHVRFDGPAGHPAERYGDEPLLIARTTGLPVFVGADRYVAGLLAEQFATTARNADATGLSPEAVCPRLHLLDDGFQHRRLARAVDVVVLHPSDLAATLLPSGRLREPLSALGRASVAVLRAQDGACAPALHRRFPHLILWQVTRKIILPEELRTTLRATQLSSAQAPAVAFCGIAHPEEFFLSLIQAGVSLAATHGYRDHHAYTPSDIAHLARSAGAAGAVALLTTEKDFVRLSAGHRAALNQAAPLYSVPLRVHLSDSEAAIRQLLGLAGLG